MTFIKPWLFVNTKNKLISEKFVFFENRAACGRAQKITERAYV